MVQVPQALPNFGAMNNKIYQPDRLAQLRNWLTTASTILITNHKNPDGDAMGSALALSHFLKKWGYPATVLVPNDYPEFLKWLPGDERVMNYETDPNRGDELIAKADLIFSLDYNHLSRVGQMEQPILASPAKKILIDHHRDPSDFADLMFSDHNSCATAQLVYELIESLELLNLLDADTATCIYTGLVTDTGSFRYPSTTAKTHHIVANLLDAGVKNGRVHQNLFDNKTETVIKMRGHVLSNNLTVLPEFKVAYITLSLDEQAQFETKSGDTEGLVNEALAVKGVVMAAFFKESHNLVKISFRSSGAFAVNELSVDHFEGGGHRNAAGGASHDSLEETIDRFLKLLPEYKNKLHVVE